MAVKNSLTAMPQKASLSAYLTSDAVKNRINEVIGGKNGTRFISSIISATSVNTQLQECTNSSVLSAALLGESLNLSPSPQLGQYYLLPFNDREKGKVAQFVLGYKGMIAMAIRSGQYRNLNAIAIKEGELIKYDPLTGEIEVNLIEDEDVRDATPTVGYYATYELLNGFKKGLYWTKKKMDAHAMKYSAGYKAKKGYTFWEKDFDGMALKTMYRQLLSTAPMSIEMQTAYEADMAVINEDGSRTYVDNVEFGEATELTPEDALFGEANTEEKKEEENK